MQSKPDDIQVSQLIIKRGDVQLSRPLDFGLSSGQVLQVTGANGVGKSTLLNMLAGLLPVISGQVVWHGHRPEQWSRLFIGHQPAIDDRLTVKRNIEFLYQLQSADYEQSFEVNWQKIYTDIDLLGYEDEKINRLSAGQKQRIKLAKLFLEMQFIEMKLLKKQSTPVADFVGNRLWILDEPMTALDVNMQAQIQQMINQFCALGGRVILTSHQALSEITCPVPVLNLD